MAKFPPLQAPPKHGDEAEHRRLLALRANASLPKNGGESMSGPLPLQPVTVADLPTASDWAGALVYVTDETGGATVAYSNGTNWLRVYDNATVS